MVEYRVFNVVDVLLEYAHGGGFYIYFYPVYSISNKGNAECRNNNKAKSTKIHHLKIGDEMKPSTVKMLKQATRKRYDTEFINYKNADSYYIEIFTNVRRVIKIEATTEKQAIDRALKKEERRLWNNLGYKFIDCDYNIVEEKDYATHRQNHKKA